MPGSWRNRARRFKWPGVRRLLRYALYLALFLLFAPIPVIALFRVVEPPVTSLMLQRAAHRLVEGKRPVFPTRTVINDDAIAPALKRAVLASEDDRFYLHNGFDMEEIRRALERRRAGGKLRGASTITQQVAKNIFLWNGRSWFRKGYEAWLTLWLELLLPKDRILVIYLNLAEWGDGVFGAEAAARKHFGKSASRLTREEAARLAAILPSPVRWSANGSVATNRIGPILERMQYAAPHPPANPVR